MTAQRSEREMEGMTAQRSEREMEGMTAQRRDGMEWSIHRRARRTLDNDSTHR